MHGNINTRDRYTTCASCGRDAAFDLLTHKCTVNTCEAYFAKLDTTPDVVLASALVLRAVARMAPTDRPPSTREIIEAERAVLQAAKRWRQARQSKQSRPTRENEFDEQVARLSIVTALQRLEAVERDA